MLSRCIADIILHTEGIIMVNFLLVRHGYSVSNRDGIFTGQDDVALDSVGIEQAEELKEYVVKNYKIDCIYSSDLSRAVETVQPIANVINLPVNKVFDLREISIGDWEGIPIDKLQNTFGAEYDKFRREQGLYKFKNGESYYDGLQRSKKALFEIANKNDEKNILIGTHGGIIRMIIAECLGIPYNKLNDVSEVCNCSVTHLHINGEIMKIGDIGYCKYISKKTK